MTAGSGSGYPSHPLASLFAILAVAAVATCLAATAARAAGGTAPPPPPDPARVEQAAADIAAELAQICPPADPASEPALAECRTALYGDSQLRRHLHSFALWGRQADPNRSLKDTHLTQFAPDVLTGMYVPLFMFNGDYVVRWHESEGRYQIRLRAAFRNRLPPGQFPYPFWHEAEKWNMYENANELILWWDLKAARVNAAQFTVHGANPPVRQVAVQGPPRRGFDGQWRWTDDRGRPQPAVAAFVGLLRGDNPYLAQVETAYRSFALRLREGQCMDCHVPSNPDRMKKLVLLQTPVHAAAEIKRVLKSVLEDRMPRDEVGIEQPLDARAKAALLAEGAAFDRVLDQARQWQAEREALAAAVAPMRTKAESINEALFRSGLASR